MAKTGANGRLLVEITETSQQTVRAEADLLRGEISVEGVDPDDDSDADSDEELGGIDDAADDDGSGPGSASWRSQERSPRS